MFRQKSYSLYKSFFKNPPKIRINQNRTYLIENRSCIFQSSSSSSNQNFPSIKSIFNKNPNHSLKRSKSFKQSVDYKFYKLLKKSPLTPKHGRNKFFNYREIIDKSPFNFDFKGEDEIIKRIKKINKGNKKHKILSELANKKQIEKRKKTKKFLNEMKLTKINIRLVKKKVLEEKKIMINEFNNLQQKHKKKIIRLKNISFEHPQTNKNLYHNNSGTIISLNKLFDKERKMVIKKDKLMHRFHEIMSKLKAQSEK